jgi:hypothetical protein
MVEKRWCVGCIGTIAEAALEEMTARAAAVLLEGAAVERVMWEAAEVALREAVGGAPEPSYS